MSARAETLTFLAWFVVVPTAAFAQAVIAGTVKDPSGARASRASSSKPPARR